MFPGLPSVKSSEKKLILLPSSYLEVRGRSNINRFACEIETFSQSDTLRLTWESDTMVQFHQSVIQVPVNEFDCTNRMIRRDFLDMVKSEEFPYLKLELKWLRWDHKAWSVGQSLKGSVIVTLANVSRTYPQEFKLYIYNSTVTLSGDKQLSMHDFNLEVPTKVAGLIRVKPDVEVHFDLKLKMPASGWLPY